MTTVIDQVEIRILGPLAARRADGSVVDMRELRTGKTADLLRLLALRNAEPVDIETLLAALWPDVERAKGLASLRTATSQIRRALQQNCIVHQYDGLVLTSCWVDVTAFRQLAGECRVFAAQQRWDRVVAAAREALGLYVGDVRAHDAGVDALNEARTTLRELHQAVLLDAADASVALRWYRDATDLAREALTHDAYSERAVRALMLAQAGLGETRAALRTFDDCRRLLADELGADPAPQTCAVHLQVLRWNGERSADTAVVVGRAEERAQLTGLITEALRRRRTELILVTGEHGIGKTAFVEHTAATLPVQTTWARGWESLESLVAKVRKARLQEPALLVIDDCELLERSAAATLSDELVRADGALVAVAVSRAASAYRDDSMFALLARENRLHRMVLPPLCRADVTELAAHALASAPSEDLVDRLMSETAGTPGRVRDLLSHWLTSGAVVATSLGLDLAPSTEPGADASRGEWARIYERLSPELLDVLTVLAVLGTHTPGSTLAGLLPEAPAEIEQRLLWLVDVHVLRSADGGYAFRTPWVRDAVLAWMRPSERSTLHARIAQQAPLPSLARMRHWLAAGEPQRAVEVATLVAAEALETGDPERARDHLLAVRAFINGPDTTPAQRQMLLELLGDAATALGRPREAAEAYRAALRVARRHGLSVGPLAAKLAGPVSPAVAEPALHSSTVGVADSLHVPQLAAELGWDLTRAPQPALVRKLRRAVRRADQNGDATAQLGLRLMLADFVLTPQRSLRESRRVVEQAYTLAGSPTARAVATAVLHRPAVLLGDSAGALRALQRAWQEVRHSDNPDAKAYVGVLLAAAVHDLGLPQLDELWQQLGTLPLESRRAAGWDWLTIRVLTERGDYDEALARAALGRSPAVRPLDAQMHALSIAHLDRCVWRRAAGAEDGFLRVVAQAHADNVVLLAPEAQAWAAEAAAWSDPAGASARLDAMDALTGEVMLGRERCARMLATAAIRANSGNLGAARDITGAAVRTAQALGLVFLQAQALDTLAQVLVQAGQPRAANDALRRAQKLLRRAGAPLAADRLDADGSEHSGGGRTLVTPGRPGPVPALAGAG
jgi:DNA-binding SARP family transcriptional activator/tetratricopeptide (TPR) repeat protein